MFKILMSACLCGVRCRYDGRSNDTENDIVKKWMDEGRIVQVCPEVAGGLSIPRDPGEIINGKVITDKGRDVTEEYEKGAREALHLAKENDVIFAVMKENSPSCGSHKIYDGTFSGTKIPGMGKAAQLLSDNGFKVYSEHQIIDAYKEMIQEEF